MFQRCTSPINNNCVWRVCMFTLLGRGVVNWWYKKLKHGLIPNYFIWIFCIISYITLTRIQHLNYTTILQYKYRYRYVIMQIQMQIPMQMQIQVQIQIRLVLILYTISFGMFVSYQYHTLCTHIWHLNYTTKYKIWNLQHKLYNTNTKLIHNMQMQMQYKYLY